MRLLHGRKKKMLLLGLLVLGMVLQGLVPTKAFSQDGGAQASLLAFNRAAISGDLPAVERHLSSRFLRSSGFEAQRLRDPRRLEEEVRLMSFYQIVGEEHPSSQEARVKVVQRRLVGGQEFVTRWYYLVKEGGLWKLDRIGQEMPYR